MPFISVSDGLIKKSTTNVENKFITKYLPVLEPIAAKVYLYSLFLFQSGSQDTISDMAEKLGITEEKTEEYFKYLEEFELVSIVSHSPFEIKILECENISGTPKKFKPEKYSDFTKTIQNILKGRMISTNEFMEYFVLLEDYGLEQDALIMIINYCVNMHGDKIRMQYIKKVAKSFAEEGAVTAKKVDEKLSAYTSSTPALINIFNSSGIRKQPDIDDDRLYKKWTAELGFEDNAIIAGAKLFKAKTSEKIDSALEELYKNRKFDVREIEDYCKNKNSLHTLTIDIAKNIGVYMQNAAPYTENYVSPWNDCGFSPDCLKKISAYCFKNGKTSFEDMNDFVLNLYNEGIVDDKSVDAYLIKSAEEDKLLKNILSLCGLTRKIVPHDRGNLSKWREWNFSDEMLLEAAKISAGKTNPSAYMNGILSSWKSDGIFTKDKISSQSSVRTPAAEDNDSNLRAEIERHYFDLRHSAEAQAEAALSKATSDKIYGEIRRQLNELNIKLAFSEFDGKSNKKDLSVEIQKLEQQGEKRLSELCIDKDDFIPRYSCKICKDTGYDQNGNACKCLKQFISTLKKQ